MTRYRTHHLVAMALLIAASLIGCSRSDSPETDSGAAASSPVSGATESPSSPSRSASPGALGASPRPSSVPSPASTPTATTTAPRRFDAGRVSLTAEEVAAGFTEPLLVTHAGDGSGRLFVLEKIGRIRLLDGSTFLDIRDRVTSPQLFSTEREQGLLGLAFHPRFAENGYFYVHYNDLRGNHVISRFRVKQDGLADPASEKVILTQDQPERSFNGGMILFGADGYLYIGLGTGGAKRELQDNAQNLGSLLGKILRIDVDRGDPYGIPPDNPFVGRAGARPEVWAYGLRNPWRFSFDRATGDLYIGGPGEFQREWINFQAAGTPPGQNFGWPILEGNTCYQRQTCDRSGLQLPILEYKTYQAGNCVVIGGQVYRGQRYPLLQGAYLYGDFCTGRIWAAARDANGAWISTEMLKLDNTLISSFGEDAAGELYVTDIYRGMIYRLVASPR